MDRKSFTYFSNNSKKSGERRRVPGKSANADVRRIIARCLCTDLFNSWGEELRGTFAGAVCF